MLYEEKIIETIPVGPLGLIPLKSCAELGKKVDEYLVAWRKERESEHKSTIAFAGYQRDSYIAVSYTHLDVYKRQEDAMACMWESSIWIKFEEAVEKRAQASIAIILLPPCPKQ